MEERRFDDLTRRLAGATSRRRVLKALALGAATSVAGTLGGGVAAKGNGNGSANGNSGAAHFCAAVFPPGPERGTCVSDAAHGTGLYYECHGSTANVCQSATGPSCPDFTSDANNCGSCGNTCDGGAPCLDGSCGCPENQTLCGTGCVALCAGGQELDLTTCQCGCPANYQYCPASQSCVYDECVINPGYHIVFDPETCGCTCAPGYVQTPGGYCAVPCQTDSDCTGVPYADYCGTAANGLQVCTNRGTFVMCPTCVTDADCYQKCASENGICVGGVCQAAI